MYARDVGVNNISDTPVPFHEITLHITSFSAQAYFTSYHTLTQRQQILLESI